MRFGTTQDETLGQGQILVPLTAAAVEGAAIEASEGFGKDVAMGPPENRSGDPPGAPTTRQGTTANGLQDLQPRP
jgi:hypothetical protein